MNRVLSKDQLQSLCDVAIQAAKAAGQWIESVDRENLQHLFKNSGSSEASQIVTEVDIRSEEIIRQHLSEVSQQFNIAFVGEESCFSDASSASERFVKPYFGALIHLMAPWRLRKVVPVMRYQSHWSTNQVNR